MAIEWEEEAVDELRERRYIGQLEQTVELFQERIAELEFASEDWGWTKLGSDSNYEFSISHLQRIIARSRLFFLQNPLINRAVTLQADYVFAQGVTVQATHKIVDKVIQEFIDDPQNQREFTSHQARLLKEQTLIIDGNIFFVLFTDKVKTGRVQLRSIIADEITDVITNPDDANEVWFYKREWQTKKEDGTDVKQNMAYYPDIDHMPIKNGPLPKTRNGKQIYWDAPILHVKSGALAKSRFGVPETYSALDWAKAHSKMLADWATIIATLARYALKVTTPGGSKGVVAARNKLQTSVGTGNLGETNPPSTVGSIFIRQKDGVDIEPFKTSGATASAKDARELRIMVAAAMGLPDPMLSGEVDVGNLATAKTLDRPTELKFRSRQQVWQSVQNKIFQWVVRWAIEAKDGLLNNAVKVTIDNRGQVIYEPKPMEGKETSLAIQVTFPPILEKTIQERIDAIIGAVTLNGKAFAIDSEELKKLTIRLQLQALGVNDVDELVDLIFATIEEEPDEPTTTDPNANPEDSSTTDSEPDKNEIRI